MQISWFTDLHKNSKKVKNAFKTMARVVVTNWLHWLDDEMQLARQESSNIALCRKVWGWNFAYICSCHDFRPLVFKQKTQNNHLMTSFIHLLSIPSRDCQKHTLVELFGFIAHCSYEREMHTISDPRKGLERPFDRICTYIRWFGGCWKEAGLFLISVECYQKAGSILWLGIIKNH